jgi:predicted nucleic acid-binding protein
LAAIVSDTTPLNHLVLINAVELLPRLYQRVLIPPAVRDDLTRPKTPEIVRFWMAQPPSWLEVVTPALPPDPALSHLDDGETQAIALALESRTELLLLDERDATIAARERGLTVTGTIGVLDRAAALAWIDLPTMFARLGHTTFRSPVRLMATPLEQDAARKQEKEG